MNVLGVIPARYASSRFPGKPLALIAGKPMVWHVYTRARQALENVVIATDNTKIYEELKSLGAQVVMTSDKHRSGTERCAEAADKMAELYKKKIDIVVNIQGDEPLIDPKIIEILVSSFDCNTQIATLIRQERDFDNLFNPNVVKVLVDKYNNAIYFSRQVIPYLRDISPELWPQKHRYFTHIGIYAYRYQTLHEIVKLPQSTLEQAEKLEQLRWLENSYKIKTSVVEYNAIGVDTPEDLERIKALFESYD